MTTIIIPTYNENGNIAQLLERIFKLKIKDLNVIVVDDNSRDGTANTVKAMMEEYPIEIIERSGKFGIGSAYIAGMKKALKNGADYIFEMDADFSHDPADIPRLLEMANNCDLAIGSRRVPGGKIEGWSLWRHFTSSGAMWFSRIILNLKTLDVTSGFRCYRAEALKLIPLDAINSNGYAFQEEMLYRIEKLGLSVREVPVTFVDRQRGKSKLGKKDIIEFFKVMIGLNIKKSRF